MVPDLLQVIALRARLEDLDGIPIININDVPLRGFNSVLKRAIDIGFSAAGLLVLALPLGVIALLIRLSSPGPVFFRQERMGLDGKSFWMYKFRSMYDEAERDTGPVWAREDDPRCTPVGRFLRRSNLDELPQLWNVLRGDMSLVGPRPERPFFVEQFKHTHAAVHAAPQGEGRPDRLGAGQRLARQHLDREADRVRPLLHRELVGPPRPQDHVADARARASSTSTRTKQSADYRHHGSCRHHRRRRLHRLAPRRSLPRPRRHRRRHRQPAHRRHREHRAPRRPRLPVHQARRHQLHLHRRAGGLRAALRQPGQPDRLPRAADPDAEGRRARHAQGARPGQGQGRPVPHRLDLRGLRRPARAPAEGTTGATSTRSARAASTTRPSASPRP